MSLLNNSGEFDSTQARVLIVAVAVLTDGPITLGELEKALPISRGSIWRCLDTLRDGGHVRMRSGDNAFELTNASYKLVANAHCSALGIEEAAQAIQLLTKLGPFHTEFGAFEEMGTFKILETSIRNGYAAKRISLTDDHVAVAAQLSIPPILNVKHLERFIENATIDERLYIQSGEHAASLRQLRMKRIVWSEDESSFAFPFGIEGFPHGAMRVELKTMTTDSVVLLKALATKLVQHDLNIARAAEAMSPDGKSATGPLPL